LRLILIALFGAIGTLARYGLQGVVQFRTTSAFPYGTLLVNLSGCFLLGLIGQFTLNRLVISSRPEQSHYRSPRLMPADLRVNYFAEITTVSTRSGNHRTS